MTSLKFALVVYGAPYSSEGCLSALQFAEAVIAEGHEILRVFFYHEFFLILVFKNRHFKLLL